MPPTLTETNAPELTELPRIRFGEALRDDRQPVLPVPFYSRSLGAWIGEFLPGYTGYSDVLPHPDGNTAVIVSRGQVYHLDPDCRAIECTYGGAIEESARDPSGKLLVLAADCRLWLIGSGGLEWKSWPIPGDAFRRLSLRNEKLTGQAYDSRHNTWREFAILLAANEQTTNT